MLPPFGPSGWALFHRAGPCPLCRAEGSTFGQLCVCGGGGRRWRKRDLSAVEITTPTDQGRAGTRRCALQTCVLFDAGSSSGGSSRSQASGRSNALPRVAQVCLAGACVVAWSGECRHVNSGLSLTRGEGPSSSREVALGRRHLSCTLKDRQDPRSREGTSFLVEGRWAVCPSLGQGIVMRKPDRLLPLWSRRAVRRRVDLMGSFGPVASLASEGHCPGECQVSKLLSRKHLPSCWRHREQREPTASWGSGGEEGGRGQAGLLGFHREDGSSYLGHRGE